MKILKNIIIAIVVLVVIVLVVGFFAPRNVSLERSVTINATPASIFEEINGIKALNSWNPWYKIDPEIKSTFEGSETGVGSKVSWLSEHSEVGNGSQEIIEMKNNEMVRTEMFFEGFDNPNYSNLIITSEGNMSTVLWTFEGDMGENPIWKLFGLMMESQLGPSYEEGLSNLKTLVESKPKFAIQLSIEDVAPITYLAIKNTFDVTKPELVGPKMGELYGKIGGYMAANKIQFGGMPMSIYIEENETDWIAEIAIPCTTDGLSPKGNIFTGTTPGGKVIKGIHLGDYFKLGDSHAEVKKFMTYKGLEASGNGFEIYVTDPSTEPDTAKWLTEIFYPVK